MVVDYPTEEYYDITRCVEWIILNKFQHIALQFPDYLISDATLVIKLLKKELPDTCYLFILGDTSYGSCCVDEVAAEHMMVDCIIHYGNACLSPTKRYPTFYVFGRKPLNFEDFKANITGLESEHILITYDVQYAHFSEYFDTCHEEHNHIIFTKLLNTVDTVDNNNDHYFNHSGRAAVLSAHISEYTLVHIGTESNFLTGLIMTHSKNPIYSYNPETQEYRRENAHVNKSLNRRFFMVEKAKDCEMFGILVGTLSVSQYMDSISRIKKIIQDAGKSFYTFVVGKINVEKLANFAEIEMFVLVACPENSLIDSKDFLQPIITPFELEIALVPGKGWTGDYSVDFTSFLNSPLPSVEAEEEDTRISLVSNVVKKNHKVIEIKGPDSETGTVALRQEMGIESYEKANASKYFLQRTFQGLQMSMEELEPMVAIDGKIGTARGYRDLEEEKQK